MNMSGDSELADSEFESEKARSWINPLRLWRPMRRWQILLQCLVRFLFPEAKQFLLPIRGDQNLGAEVSDRVGETIREKGLSTASVIEGTIEGGLLKEVLREVPRL